MFALWNHYSSATPMCFSEYQKCLIRGKIDAGEEADDEDDIVNDDR